MKTKQIEKHLRQRRNEVLARYHGELERATEELDSREIESVENATELWDARVLSKLGEVDVAALAQITAALRRLAAGTYGACADCGIAIESARLAVLPEIATCFDCAIDGERAALSTRVAR